METMLIMGGAMSLLGVAVLVFVNKMKDSD